MGNTDSEPTCIEESSATGPATRPMVVAIGPAKRSVSDHLSEAGESEEKREGFCGALGLLLCSSHCYPRPLRHFRDTSGSRGPEVETTSRGIVSTTGRGPTYHRENHPVCQGRGRGCSSMTLTSSIIMLLFSFSRFRHGMPSRLSLLISSPSTPHRLALSTRVISHTCFCLPRWKSALTR